jgi:hypothetical protein
MPSSEWLDIAIGVVVVWFLFSLVVSATNEAINRVLAIRAKQLWQGLDQLLDGATTQRNLIADTFGLPRDLGAKDPRPSDPEVAVKHLAAAQQAATAGTTPPVPPALTDQLYATKTVQALENHPASNKMTRIAHLPPAVFAQALIELGVHAPTGGERTIQQFLTSLPADIPAKAQLETLWATASGDINQFRVNVEGWFDGQMTRLTSLYRAKIRIVLTMLGVALSVAAFGIGLRSDAFGLVSDLQRNQNLRTALDATANQVTSTDLAAQAGGACAPPGSGSGSSSTTSTIAPGPATCQLVGVSKLKGLDLRLERDADRPGQNDSVVTRLGLLFKRPMALLGVLVTGLAISFGSTFWYDALRKLVGLRDQGGGRTAT